MLFKPFMCAEINQMGNLLNIGFAVTCLKMTIPGQGLRTSAKIFEFIWNKTFPVSSPQYGNQAETILRRIKMFKKVIIAGIAALTMDQHSRLQHRWQLYFLQ